MKPMRRVLSVALTAGLSLAAVASGQVRRPTLVNYSRFRHSSHAGSVKSLVRAGLFIDLDCAYCHGTAVKDKRRPGAHDIGVLTYPYRKLGDTAAATHSACAECHAMNGPKMQRPMCTICHATLTPQSQVMRKNLPSFPKPQVFESQFADLFSHKTHTDYFDKFDCAACHVVNSEPVVVAGLTFKKGVKQSAPSHPECFVCHFDPKMVSPPRKGKSDPKNTYATNCVGCHSATATSGPSPKPAAAHWFIRQVVTTEKKPFSHADHDFLGKKADVNRAAQACLACHAAGKTARQRGDFYLDSRTQQRQPLVGACVACHDYDHKKEAQAKIAGLAQLPNSLCLNCHALKTITSRAKSGLPPASHLAPVPTPTPKPSPTPTPAPKTQPVQTGFAVVQRSPII
jgi:cytochrome c553